MKVRVNLYLTDWAAIGTVIALILLVVLCAVPNIIGAL